MTDMNFFPPWHHKWYYPLLAAGTVMAIILMLMAGAYFAYYAPLTDKTRMQRTHQDLLAFSNNHKDLMSACESLEEELVSLQGETAMLTDVLQGFPADWLFLLEGFEQAQPPKLLISQLVFDRSTLILTGYAGDDLTAAQFAVNLEAGGRFHNVRMERLIYQENGITFELRCMPENISEE